MRSPSWPARAAPGPPELNQQVRLELPELGCAVTSRVEDVETLAGGRGRRVHRLGVAAPRIAGSLAWERGGASVLVRWVTGRGPCLLRCAFERRVPGKVPQWVLRSLAPVSLEQRRRYVRARVLVPARLGVRPPVDGDVVPDEGEAVDTRTVEPSWHPARLVDLSERGARLALSLDLELDLAAGAAAFVELAIGERLCVPGTMLRVHDEPNARLVVVELEPGDSAATLIRRAVLDAQVRARRLSAR